MNWLSEQLNIKTMEDWYNVSLEVKIKKLKKNLKIEHKDILRNYGNTLIKRNENSHIKLITSFYPNYHWLPWKFKHLPKGFWQDKQNHQRKYLDYLAKELNINDINDWYKVSVNVSISYSNRYW